MNKTKAAILSFIALLILTVSVLVSCGSTSGTSVDGAGTQIENSGLKFTLMDDGTYSVGLGRSLYSSTVVIPPSYNGRAVTAIADNGFADATDIQSITIPPTITKIGADAFKNCIGIEQVHISDLRAWCEVSIASVYSTPLYYSHALYVNGDLAKDIEIPEGTKHIGKYTFAYCTDLESIKLSDSVASIGDYAFASCAHLENIILGSSVRSIGIGAFNNALKVKYNKLGNVNYLGNESSPYLALVSINGAVQTGKYLKVDESTVVIASAAFEKCESLVSLELGKNIKSINSSAFSGCENLQNVYISDMAAWCSIDFGGYQSNPLYYADNLFLNKAPVTELNDSNLPKNVTRVAPYAFYNYESLTSVTLHGEITEIGAHAFAHCQNLAYINPGNATKTIGERAFDSCVKIKQINFGKATTNIGNYAFSSCTGLKEIILEGNIADIGKFAFSDCSNAKKLTLGSSVRSVGDGAFNACKRITEVNASDGVLSIGSRAFRDCSGIMSFTLPSTLLSIGDDAFVGCYKLFEVINFSNIYLEIGSSENGYVAKYAKTVHSQSTKIEQIDGFCFYSDGISHILLGTPQDTSVIVLPDSYNGEVYTICEYAFANNTEIKGVTITDGVYEIGNHSFEKCDNLNSVDMTNANALVSIGDFAFYMCEELTEISIGSSVVSVGKSAFEACKSLLSVRLGESTVSIGEDAFYKCIALSDIFVFDQVRSFGKNAFCDCTSIKNVELEDLAAWCAVTFDGYYANPLYYAKNLSLNDEITVILNIPEGVTGISPYAFYNFKGIISVSLPSTLTKIGDYAFYGNSRLAEVINLSSLEIIKGDRGNGNVAEYAISLHSSESKTSNRDDLIFLYESGKAYLLAYIGTQRTVVLPNAFDGGKYEIYTYAFANTGVQSITIPSSVTAIGNYAFFRAVGLTEIVIPGTVSSIGSYAFAEATNLKSVTVGAGVTDIGAFAFFGCSSLQSLNLDEGLLRIGSAAFFNCSNLTAVSIPSSVNQIGSFAFSACTDLKTIVFNDAKDWRYFDTMSQAEEIRNTLADNENIRMLWLSSKESDAIAELLKNDYLECFLVKMPAPPKQSDQA